MLSARYRPDLFIARLAEPIVELIARQFEQRPGNYPAFFSS